MTQSSPGGRGVLGGGEWGWGRGVGRWGGKKGGEGGRGLRTPVASVTNGTNGTCD